MNILRVILPYYRENTFVQFETWSGNITFSFIHSLDSQKTKISPLAFVYYTFTVYLAFPCYIYLTYLVHMLFILFCKIYFILHHQICQRITLSLFCVIIDIFYVPYILAYKSRNFGQFLPNIFLIRLIVGSQTLSKETTVSTLYDVKSMFNQF